MYQRSIKIDAYSLVEAADIDLTSLGDSRIGDMVVSVIDPVADYADLLESLFDFGRTGAPGAAGISYAF